MRTIGACALLLSALSTPVAARPAPHWAASWAASPAPPMASGAGLPAAALAKAFRNQTIVQTVRLSAGGTGLRVRLTNEYGSQPLKIGAARVALIDDRGVEIAGSSRVLTFSGNGGTVIPAGAPWLKVPIAHAEAVLNHVSGTLSGVAGTYWLYKYAKEKRQALTKWERRLERIMKTHGVDLV